MLIKIKNTEGMRIFFRKRLIKIILLIGLIFLVFGCISTGKPSYDTGETVKLEFYNFEYQTLKFWNQQNQHLTELPLDNCNNAVRVDSLTWEISLKPC